MFPLTEIAVPEAMYDKMLSRWRLKLHTSQAISCTCHLLNALIRTYNMKCIFSRYKLSSHNWIKLKAVILFILMFDLSGHIIFTPEIISIENSEPWYKDHSFRTKFISNEKISWKVAILQLQWNVQKFMLMCYCDPWFMAHLKTHLVLTIAPN